MTRILAGLAIVALASPVLAQGYPIRGRDRDAAPQGYTRSGGYFVPNSRDARPAIPRRRGEACPYGTNPSGGACVSLR